MTVLLLLALLVFLPVVVALLSETSLLQRPSTRPAFSIGAPIVYRQQAVSTCPTTDGHDIRPSERGEYYYYSIINYLRVAEVLGDGRIIAVARNNQCLCFRPNERRANEGLRSRPTQRALVASL